MLLTCHRGAIAGIVIGAATLMVRAQGAAPEVPPSLESTATIDIGVPDANGPASAEPVGSSSAPAAAPVPPPTAWAIPLRDMVEIRGVRENQLIGYGLIVGLAGTGDGTQAKFTIQSIANALQRMGVVVPVASIRVRNVAAVMVTTELPPFARPGTRIDVNIASIGDAKSLTGGTLLMTPLRAADGRTYAIAQGPISLGGAYAAGGATASVQKNHPTTGVIPAGALVERAAGVDLVGKDALEFELRQPNFTTAQRIETALKGRFAGLPVQAVDAGTVRIAVPVSLRQHPVEFLALALETKVEPDVPARVVLNERTGTVVTGGDVMISRVSITHGNLTISIANDSGVSQPAPFSPKGETVVVPKSQVVAEETAGRSLSLADGTRVQELVGALQKLGLTPRDMITIFQAIRAAGALHAELVVI